MRIISPFKDYYDYISHELGADPKFVYVRRPLRPVKLELTAAEKGVLRMPLLSGRTATPCSLSEVIVAGRYVFPMIRYYQLEKLLDDSYRNHTVKYEIVSEEHAHLFAYSWKPPVIPSRTPPEDLIYSIIKKVGAPVFIMREFEVQERIPILKDTPIPGVIPATEMWQNIFYVLSTVLRSSPDKEPPCVIDNDARIEAAGFDLQTSFRHPVHLSKVK